MVGANRLSRDRVRVRLCKIAQVQKRCRGGIVFASVVPEGVAIKTTRDPNVVRPSDGY